jgi:hypothetical protein
MSKTYTINEIKFTIEWTNDNSKEEIVKEFRFLVKQLTNATVAQLDRVTVS